MAQPRGGASTSENPLRPARMSLSVSTSSLLSMRYLSNQSLIPFGRRVSTQCCHACRGHIGHHPQVGESPCDPEGLLLYCQTPMLPESYHSKLWEHMPLSCLQIESEDESSSGKKDEPPSPSQADRVCCSFLFCRVCLAPWQSASEHTSPAIVDCCFIRLKVYSRILLCGIEPACTGGRMRKQ